MVIHSRVPEPYSRNPDRIEFGEEDMANVQVTGLPREMPGLKGSLTTFRKHNTEVGDALLNLAGVGTATGGIADIEDPRPEYQHQSWPAMGYHPDGREAVAETSEEAKDLEAKGFRMRQPFPKPQVAVEDPKVEKARILQEAADARALNSKLLETINQMNERLAQLEAEKKTGPKK